jgi:sensor histidine kinase YesM
MSIKMSRKFWRRVAEFAFLVASYFILLSLFSDSKEWEKIDHIYTLIFLLTIVFSLIVNFLILIPFLLNEKRYIIYVFSVAINLLIWTLVNLILFDKWIDYILPGYYFISYYEFKHVWKFFLTFNVVTTLMHLSWEWFSLQEAQQQVTRLEKEKIAAEFKALIQQVNPHFLFNSLTVLYSLALNNSKETPTAVLKLSDILRYTLYDSEKKFVPIKSEADLIENYIDLQRYRLAETVRISFQIDLADPNINIHPMLLLPLVENSFKHGFLEGSGNSFVEMELSSANNQIEFVIRNSREDEGKNITLTTNSGIGLQNVRERLRLAYAENATLSVVSEKESFLVHLIIKEVV